MGPMGIIGHDGISAGGVFATDHPIVAAQIRAFKIIQESLDFTRVLIVTENGLSEVDTSQISASFQARLGQEVVVKVEQVTEIPAEKSGKFRYVISKVAGI